MSIDVTVLRVFTDSDGNFGNPLGVVDAARSTRRSASADRNRIGLQRNGFRRPARATGASTATHASTPRATELPFAGHPTVGASWWLRDRGTPINTLQVPAGMVQVHYDDDVTTVSARSEWAPEFAIHDLDSSTSCSPPTQPTIPTTSRTTCGRGSTRSAGSLRSRMFAANLGVPEDEATGSAAVRITDYLSRDLTSPRARDR